jgi:hypothetical protein
MDAAIEWGDLGVSAHSRSCYTRITNEWTASGLLSEMKAERRIVAAFSSLDDSWKCRVERGRHTTTALQYDAKQARASMI